MKLRNKKTGENVEIGSLPKDVIDAIEISVLYAFKDFEIVRSKEPLIKDPGIRKALRAWAEANDFSGEINVMCLGTGTRFNKGYFGIEFADYVLKTDGDCTIEELCGSKE